MVRCSLRQSTLNRLDGLLVEAIKNAATLNLLGLSTCKIDALIDRLNNLRRYVTRTRHLKKRTYRTEREHKFDLCLRTDHDDHLADDEFKFHFRVSRDCFDELVDTLKDHSSFKKKNSDSRGRRPKPAASQLLVLMKYYGCEGNAGSSKNLSTFFGIASGTVDDCKKNALDALLSIEDRTYFWPSTEERKGMSSRMKDQWLFPNCVGLIDGALLPLFQRPSMHGENCMSRKKFYAMVMLVVCDDAGRIIYYHIGWPGSVHDNRVWRNCNLFKKHSQYFGPKECLLGDSAFTASDIIVPPFKCPAGSELDSNKTAFNTHLAKPRVKSEHCIGILKGRLPFLRSMRCVLGNKLHMKRIVDIVRGAVILHNFLVEDPIDEDWIQSEDVDDLEPETRNAPSNQPDHRRRDELMHCLSESEETTID